MASYLSIGDFSRATHLTVKTLRHYHQLGLLEPAAVDPVTGYRRYEVEQIGAAQVIRRLRDLDMPLEEIQALLAAPDLASRNGRLTAHLSRMEAELARTQGAVEALRNLLAPATEVELELRAVPETPVLAITETVAVADACLWLQGALGELYGLLAAQGATPDGPPGGVYGDDFFAEHRGTVTVYVPCAAPVRPLGRATATALPAVDLAVMVHAGPAVDTAQTYGVLAAHVARHALPVDGPIREHYLVGPRDTPDSGRWRTEIGWPVFRTGAG
ncbi:MerR family transcriptional regulator [Kitasatospora acidiphila]|uniref:MerR family transcriptional regulator n=1 Tax=Kitasatospora acidiphila TaxID=2567942 RepID=A0A540W5H1_9ACTN|nr:MerR family transcriptional regulator [Kitasatospora acidiphila]TQF04250.1 MerR family transcriptional regulator [Kitasatospora acidiphila]